MPTLNLYTPVRCCQSQVQEASYMSICDLLVMFAPQLANACPTLKPLVQRAPDQLQHALLDFVRDFVFVMPEEDDGKKETIKKHERC